MRNCTEMFMIKLISCIISLFYRLVWLTRSDPDRVGRVRLAMEGELEEALKEVQAAEGKAQKLLLQIFFCLPHFLGIHCDLFQEKNS